MSSTQMLFSLTFAFLLATVSDAATVTIKNNCQQVIWPATQTADQKPQLSTTGFELSPKETATIEVPSPWSGRFWARTRCTTNAATSRFSCETGDCGSSGIACIGNGGAPPATLVEITVAAGGGKDFYDVSNVDGFNVPVSVGPIGGFGECKPSSCPAKINAVCPEKFAVKASNSDDVIACKSACVEFGQPEFCCTGDHDKPETCPPTSYSQFFEDQCPEAYSYAFDDKSSTFTCSGDPDYIITFCPQ